MSSNNDTLIIVSDSITLVLDLIRQKLIYVFPLILVIFGSIGFIGNAFTFLQPNLRSNPFCIYTLASSIVDVINLFLNLLSNTTLTSGKLLSSITTSHLCKLELFSVAFIPQLSMNLLILSLIDRYACTCSLTSAMRYLRPLKMVPWLIGITVIISGLMSLYSPLLYDIIPGFGCTPTDPLLNGVLYIIIHGLLTPFVMHIFVCLTYRNVKKSRQRVGVITTRTIQHNYHRFIGMVFIQVIVTSFFILQWIGMYIYFIFTQYNNKTDEQWAIDFFTFSLTNTLYYMINVKSFYLSTLTSKLFRETFIKSLLKLFGQSPRQQRTFTITRVHPKQ